MTRMKCCVCEIYHNLLDVPKQPTCMNGGYRELYQQLQSPSGRARANGTRASVHVTFQRTTSERKLCFSTKLRRQRCCLAERCLQGILPACRPIHCPRPGARASKKGRERARTSSGFLIWPLCCRVCPQCVERCIWSGTRSDHLGQCGVCGNRGDAAGLPWQRTRDSQLRTHRGRRRILVLPWCVCVCVCVRERERERDRELERGVLGSSEREGSI